MDAGVSVGQLGLSLAAGGLTTLSPCVFPVLPLVVGGAVQANRLAPIAIGLGMAASFAAIGLLLGAAGPALGIDAESVRKLGAWLLIAFGVVLLVPRLSSGFSGLMTPIANSAQAASTRLDGASLGGALLLGALLGLVWSPCSGPLLASALTMVAAEGGALRGGIMLGVFGLGAAIPLMAVAYASRSGFARARGRVLSRIDTIKRIFGALLAVTGAAILGGYDKWLESKVIGMLPDAWLRLTTLF